MALGRPDMLDDALSNPGRAVPGLQAEVAEWQTQRIQNPPR